MEVAHVLDLDPHNCLTEGSHWKFRDDGEEPLFEWKMVKWEKLDLGKHGLFGVGSEGEINLSEI